MSKTGEGDARKSEDLERRLQMAVDEMRELKRANSDLENKLTKARSSGPAAGPVQATGLDWEAQKQRLLASLEADDPQDEEEVAERNTIEGTIRITDQIVALKDEEISDLKRRLEEQSGSKGSKAAAEGEVADILDRDEIVRAERERLQQLQLEWREKIGKAETDLSVERRQDRPRARRDCRQVAIIARAGTSHPGRQCVRLVQARPRTLAEHVGPEGSRRGIQQVGQVARQSPGDRTRLSIQRPRQDRTSATGSVPPRPLPPGLCCAGAATRFWLPARDRPAGSRRSRGESPDRHRPGLRKAG